MRAAATGPKNGMPDIVSAAEQPISAAISGSFSGSWRATVAIDLDLVAESVREQRTDRPVDQARDQRLVLGRPTLALEEAAGDLSGGEALLLVVDGQREEILARLDGPGADAVHSTIVSP